MKRVLAPVLHDSAAPMSPSSRRRPDTPKWVFNRRLFLWTLGVVVLVVPAAMGWHALQLRLQTGEILTQAERDIEQEKWRSARNGLDHYLTLNPGDMEARARLAVVSDQFEQGQHILDMFAFAVAQFPERIDFRIRYAELHLASENYGQAISEAEVALKMQANEPRSLKVKALALVNEGRRTNRVTPESIKEAVEEAITAWPADVELVLQAARAMREMANARGATSDDQAAMTGWGDFWLAELVKNQSENVDAWLARYAYRRQFRLDGWESDLNRAAELEPNSPGVLLALGQRALRRRDLNEAEKYFRLLVEQAPQQPEGFLNLSAVLRRQERFEEALRLLDGALRSVGRNELSLRMERVTLQILGNQLDDVDAELQAIGRDVTRFSSQLEGSRQRRSLEEAMATLGAMYQLARGQSEQAIRTLRQVFPETRVSSPSTPNGQRHGAALEIIGQCHVIREEWELAGNALAEAARLLPERLDLAMQAAAAYERAGNWRRVARINDELRMANPAPPGVHAAYASARLEEQRRLPPAQQNWQPFQQGLESTRAAGERPGRLAVLEADYQWLRGQTVDAIRLLRQAEQVLVDSERDVADPDLELVARIYEQLDESDEADRVRALIADDLPKRLASIGRLVRQGEFEPAMRLLTELKETSTDVELDVWAPPMTRVQLLMDRAAEALQINLRLRSRSPDHREWLYEGAEIARRAGDMDEFTRASQELRRVEGERGSSWREVRLRYLLSPSGPLSSDARAEAEQLLRELEANRPEWPTRLALSGQYAARLGDRARAIDEFRRAVQLGGEEATAATLADLLLRELRVAEASEFLSLVMQIRGTLNWQQTRLPEFLDVYQAERAREWIAELPATPDTSTGDSVQQTAVLLAQGRLLLIQGNLVGAESVFRTLLGRDEHDLEAWTGLLVSTWRQRRSDEVEDYLKRLVELKLDSDRARNFLVAQGYLLLDDVESAGKYYRLALADWDSADRNQSEHLAQSYVQFLERLEPAEAVEALRERIRKAPDDRYARRRLVSILTAQGGEARWHEVDALLEEAFGREWDSEVELARRRAALELARGGDSAIPRAVKILRDEVIGSSEVEVEDHLFLAQLHGRQGEFELEREQLNEALERQPGNALGLGRLFDLVMDRLEHQEAEQLLVRLEEVAREWLSTSQRRVLWLFADGQRDEARKLLWEHLERISRAEMSDENRATILVNFGRQIEAIQAFEDAERVYQQAYEVDPTTLPTLLGFLVRTGRGDEAVEKCRQLVGEAGASEADAVELLCRVLTYTQVTADTARELDVIIKTALQRHNRHVALHYSAATYYQIQEDVAYARSLFERLNELMPNHPRILNNFAYFLSEQPDGLDEAREKIERAIDLAGETPGRLDTRGMVLFREGIWDEAKQDFDRALSLSPSPQPVIRFHLALTQFRLGDVSAARESLRLADEEGLATAVLSKKDRELREELEQELRHEAGS